MTVCSQFPNEASAATPLSEFVVVVVTEIACNSFTFFKALFNELPATSRLKNQSLNYLS